MNIFQQKECTQNRTIKLDHESVFEGNFLPSLSLRKVISDKIKCYKLQINFKEHVLNYRSHIYNE